MFYFITWLWGDRNWDASIAKILNWPLCFYQSNFNLYSVCILYSWWWYWSKKYHIMWVVSIRSILTAYFVGSTATLINCDTYNNCSPIRIFLLPPSEWGLRRSNIGLVGFQLYCIVVVFSHTLTFLSTITFILSVSRSVRGNVTFSNFYINTPPKSYRIILYNRIIFYWTSAVGIYVVAYHICIWN